MSKLLEADLSYKIRGCFYSVFNKYGPGLKEIIYQKALEEEFNKQKVKFYSQKRINIYSLDSGKLLGTYIPDFIVEEKIIVELKVNSYLTQIDINQQRSYLRANMYEIAYLVNFGTNKLEIKRSIYTNDRKPFYIRVNPSSVRENSSSLIRGNLCSFTLMELLIIISLIALLAAIVLILFNPWQQIGKSYDVKRKHDLNELRKAFEDYYNDKGCYPTGNVICYNTPKEDKKGVGQGATLVGYSCNICGNEAAPPQFSSFSSYISRLSCDPEHSRKDYLYQYDPVPCPSWYRIYADLNIESDTESVDLGCPLGGCGLKYPPAPTPQYGYDYGVSNTNLEVSNVYNCIDSGNICNTCNTYDECIVDPGCPNKSKIYGSLGLCCVNNPGSCP